MSEAVYIDGVLKEVGDRLFYDRPQQIRVRRTITGSFVIPKVETKFKLHQVARTRQALQRTVRRVPEVIVKISGSGRGMKRIKSHIEYISRNGSVDLEDQYGESARGMQAVNDILDEWRYGGFPIAEESNKREAFNIVLSMPPGTDREAVTNAAREFAQDEFSKNYSYVFATHTDEKHPHVHLCVKSMGRDGTRLNPRKADLQQWRERFAEKLNANGIEANATRRPVRGKTIKSVKQQAIHIQKRGIKNRNHQGQMEAVIDTVQYGIEAANPLAAKISKSREHVVKHFKAASLILERSSNPKDKELAKEIDVFVRAIPMVETTREKIQRSFWEERKKVGQRKGPMQENGQKKAGQER